MTATPKPAAPSPAAPAPSARATHWRTHACGELGEAHVGTAAKLSGTVDRVESRTDFWLRDAYGRSRVRLDERALADLVAQLDDGVTKEEDRKIPVETVVHVRGTVEREAAGGGVSLRANHCRVHSLAKAPLLFDFRDEKLPRWEKVRHRYLFLRNARLHDAFKARTSVLREARRFLLERAFIEVSTPLLANRWSPAAKDCFLAVRGPRKLFTLPGRRSVHGALLMAGGFDRVYEVARRFQRLPSYGPFEQPEFSVLDLHLAFVGEDELHALEDQLLQQLWARGLGKPAPAVTTLTFDEAWARFGTEHPDLRIEGAELVDPGALAGAAAARAVRFPGAAAQVAALGDLGGVAGATDGSATGALYRIAVGADGKPSAAPIGATTATLDPAAAAAAVKATGAKPQDLVVLALGQSPQAAARLAGAARTAAGRALGRATGPARLVRATRLPYFRYDDAAGAWTLAGDPLTLAVEAELEDDPQRLHGYAHELSLDGVPIGGGAIRNHDLSAQRKLFEVLGLSAADVDASYAQLLGAFQCGVPPHGRIAIGIDRLLARMLGFDSIDDVIAMPKMPEGNDPLTRAPTPADKGLIPGWLGL